MPLTLFLPIKHFISLRLPLLIFVGFYLILAVWLYSDFGVAIDEPMEYGFGQMLYSRYFGRDPQLIHDFAYEGQDSREIWSHNHFHTMLLYIVNDTGSVSRYHLLNLLFAVLAFWVVYEIMLSLNYSPWLCLIGPVCLFFTPRFFGDVPANVKDPVFATYYLLALLALIITVKLKSAPFRLLILGFTFGLAAAFRTLGYSLLLVYLFDRGWALRQTRKFNLTSLLSTLIQALIIFCLMVFVHGIEMPFVFTDPPRHLWRLMTVAQAFPWQGTMLYLGHQVAAGHLPWHYVPVWLGVTTPIFILFFGAAAHRYFPLRPVRILVSAFWLNLLLYFLLQPVIYDGIRHLLFLAVIVSVLAAIGWSQLWSKSQPLPRLLLVAILGLHCLAIAYQYVRLHPYQYVYFNALAGFLPGASSKFETDYWGTSYQEAARWFLSQPFAQTPSLVGLCGNEYAKEYFIGTPHQIIWLPGCQNIDPQKVDFVFAYGRNNEWDRVPGSPIYAVERLGVPLMKLFKTQTVAH